MKLLFATHLYLPGNASGSEIYLHELIKALKARGHECRVLFHGAKRMGEYDGVELFPAMGSLDDHFNRTDAVFCHLSYSSGAIQMANKKRKPCFHITHSDEKYECVNNFLKIGGVIYNSENAQRVLNYSVPWTVFHPIVRKFKVKDPFNNTYITLINCNDNKGPDVFYEIAKRMPEQKFLVVRGTYGPQIESDLPNITTTGPTNDMGSIYQMTRILLMPSKEESYGLTAAEAMAAGIPVICSVTPGLVENCGEAGIYVMREKVDLWVEEIKKLNNKKNYLRKSEICINRAFSRKDEIDDLENFITRNTWQ